MEVMSQNEGWLAFLAQKICLTHVKMAEGADDELRYFVLIVVCFIFNVNVAIAHGKIGVWLLSPIGLWMTQEKPMTAMEATSDPTPGESRLRLPSTISLGNSATNPEIELKNSGT